MALAALIYGAWLAATFWHAALPWPVRLACGGWLIAWHSSLQHEAIHGHPTPWRRVNTLLAMWPLALWLPYRLYAESHLAHHAAAELTSPGEDPESHYRAPPRGPLTRADLWLSRRTSTLLARVTLGPALQVARFGLAEAGAVARAPRRALAWLAHLAAALPVLAWLVLVCRMSVVDYTLTFIYPGVGLTLLRSFAEHRADARPDRRVAVVERAPVLGLLYLFNNLHALHHRAPGLAWYELPGAYRREREDILRANGGLVYAGYGEVVARFLLRPHDEVVHPALGVAERA